MRIRLLAVMVLAASSMSAVALAATPKTVELAKTHGRGHVTVVTTTAHLHGRLWLDRIGGEGVASGSAFLTCETPTPSETAKGNRAWFSFKLKPSGYQVIWSGKSGACGVTVVVKGKGLLTVALRGY